MGKVSRLVKYTDIMVLVQRKHLIFFLLDGSWVCEVFTAMCISPCRFLGLVH